MGYDTRISIDMRLCYKASFQVKGEAKPYFQKLRHPSHLMSRVAINGPLAEDIGTGFAEVVECEFAADCHTVVPAWYGRHFAGGGRAPTRLLAFLVESGLLRSLKVRKTMIAFEKQTEVWLPEDRNVARAVVGKFTQGSKADGKRLTRRLVCDPRQLDFLECDTAKVGPSSAPLKDVLLVTSSGITTAPSPQYIHLRASVLGYGHINLISMLSRFTQDEAVRVATDSIYVQKTALHKLEGVEAYVAPRKCSCGEPFCFACAFDEPCHPQLPLANGVT